ncbi:MAG: phosphotransferase family protein [Deltaproteobacteria bacterium]|nr:phosphotransferase family protein [Deltaproteobacteria bacterium]
MSEANAPTVIDGAGQVREGEGLDVDAIARWLEAHAPDVAPAGSRVALAQFPKGHSNLTYLLTLTPPEGAAREVVLRRGPFGSKVRSAHDMGREHRLLSGLHPLYPKAPRPIAACDDAAVLGAPFYVMERIVGVIPRRAFPKGVVVDHAALASAFVDELVALHAIDATRPGLAELGIYKGPGFAARQVAGWGGRWEAARTEPVPDLDHVLAELVRRTPPDAGAVVVHNDFKYDNLVLDPADPTRIIGVLDWEMATVGCPLMDLGTSLGYWVEAVDPPFFRMFAFGPTDAPGAWDRARIVDEYARRSGRAVADPVFYFAFGLFKIAVVAQQIYKRFVEGHTSDKRFASFGQAVSALAALAKKALDVGRVSGLG